MSAFGTIIGCTGTIAEVAWENEPFALHTTLYAVDQPDLQLVVVASASPASVYCIVLKPQAALARGLRVADTGEPLTVPVGPEILGRAFDIFGHGHDGQGEVQARHRRPLLSQFPDSLAAIELPSHVIETGIKAIDFFTPLLHGGKMALIGGAGIGKTVILTELINRLVIQTKATADRVAVFSAVGERSREAQELYDSLQRAQVLPYTSLILGQMGENPAVRWHTAFAGAAIAEYFRDVQHKDVLFFMDNIFRFAQAGHELSTLMHTIPSEDGYQPTLASEMAAIQQRLTATTAGRLTSFFALFVPSDDMTDAGVRSVIPYLDSLIILSRDVFQQGRFPAMDLLASGSSALEPDIVGPEHYTAYVAAKQLLERASSLERIVALVGESELSQENQRVYRRTQLLQNYLTQDLFISQAEIGRSAEVIPRAETVASVREILNGTYDSLAPEKLLYIGSLKNLR